MRAADALSLCERAGGEGLLRYELYSGGRTAAGGPGSGFAPGR